MHIKRFEAPNMAEALRSVKQEFGSEAVILSARTLEKKRGILGLPKNPGVEVTAAADYYHPEQRKNYSLNGREMFHKHLKTMNSSNLFQGGERDAANSLYPFPRTDSLQPSYAKGLFPLYLEILDQGVEQDIALDLMKKVNELSPLPGRSFEKEKLKECLIMACEEAGIRTSRIKISHNKPNIVVFIGPTGVGKTTTIAKFAAAAQNHRRRNRVALITIDDERIAAISQIKLYAKIIGIPVEVCSNGNELKQSIKKLKDNNLILIDTPGISLNNRSRIDEFNGLFEKIRPVENYLLLSATTKEKDLKDILERCKTVPISGLIWTKIDNSTAYGNIVNQLINTNIPMSYFTNGQQVPEDIESATVKRLVDLLISHEKENFLWSMPPEILAGNLTELEKRLESVNIDYASLGYQSSKFEDIPPVLNGVDKREMYAYGS